MRLIRRFARNQDGATAIEYGLIAALMAIACIAAFITTGNSLVNLFGYITNNSVPHLNG